MNCQEFLDRYSEYLDEEMEPPERERVERHMAECASCRRYDDVMRRGLSLVRQLPPVEISADFERRLHCRIRELEMGGGFGDESTGRSPGASVAVSLAIAAALALIAWSPLIWRERLPLVPALSSSEGGAGTSEYSVPIDRMTPMGVPFGATASVFDSGADGNSGSTRQWRLYSSDHGAGVSEMPALFRSRLEGPESEFSGPARLSRVDLTVPGPYSPLIVSPPAFTSRQRNRASLRTVSATLLD